MRLESGSDPVSSAAIRIGTPWLSAAVGLLLFMSATPVLAVDDVEDAVRLREWRRLAHADKPPKVQWTRTFAGWGTASGRCVQQTADGGYIAVGRTFSRDSVARSAAFLVKLDAAGNTQWTKAIRADRAMTAFSAVQTSDGGYIVAAATSDACLVRTNASGNEIWRSCLANDFSTGARSLVRLGDTAYTAVVQRGLGDSAVILWRTDGSGNFRWSHNYNIIYGLGPTDEDLSIRRTSDGGYIIGTKTLLKVDSLGLQPSLKTFGSVMSANSVIQTSDGGYAATGAKLDYASIYLLKTNANRDSVWMGTYVPSQCSRGKWVEQTTGGGYIIAGTTRPSNQHDKVTLVKTLPDGSPDWTDTLFGGVGCCVRQTADGGYVVAGGSGGRLFVTKLAPDRKR